MSTLTISMDSIMEKVKLVKVEKLFGKFNLDPALKYSAVGQSFCWLLHAIFVSASCYAGRFDKISITWI